MECDFNRPCRMMTIADRNWATKDSSLFIENYHYDK